MTAYNLVAGGIFLALCACLGKEWGKDMWSVEGKGKEGWAGKGELRWPGKGGKPGWGKGFPPPPSAPGPWALPIVQEVPIIQEIERPVSSAAGIRSIRCRRYLQKRCHALALAVSDTRRSQPV